MVSLRRDAGPVQSHGPALARPGRGLQARAGGPAETPGELPPPGRALRPAAGQPLVFGLLDGRGIALALDPLALPASSFRRPPSSACPTTFLPSAWPGAWWPATRRPSTRPRSRPTRRSIACAKSCRRAPRARFWPPAAPLRPAASVRGLAGAHKTMLLTAGAHNLKKLLKHRPQQHRFVGPAQAASGRECPRLEAKRAPARTLAKRLPRNRIT